MNKAISVEIGRLEKMTVNQLAEKYEQMIGEPCRSRHKRYLIRRLAWRIQADAEGGLSDRALKRAEELANDAEIRVTPPREKQHDDEPTTIKMPVQRDERIPPPGNWIEREYKGRVVQVLVVEDGFEYEGRRFRSLSGAAKAITGSHINGFQFFRLWRKP